MQQEAAMNAELEFKLRAAKTRLNRAAADCMQNVTGAAQRADQALAEVAELQRQLAAQRPKPQGAWAIAAEVKAETEGRR